MSDRDVLSQAVDSARNVVEERRLAAMSADEWKRPTKAQPIPAGLPEFLAYLAAVREWSMARHSLDCHDRKAQTGPYRNAKQEASDQKPKHKSKKRKTGY